MYLGYFLTSLSHSYKAEPLLLPLSLLVPLPTLPPARGKGMGGRGRVQQGEDRTAHLLGSGKAGSGHLEGGFGGRAEVGSLAGDTVYP